MKAIFEVVEFSVKDVVTASLCSNGTEVDVSGSTAKCNPVEDDEC